jgi:hypothetical protein
VNFRVSTVYGLKTLGVAARFVLQRIGWGHFRLFERTLPEIISRHYHEAIFRMPGAQA